MPWSHRTPAGADALYPCEVVPRYSAQQMRRPSSRLLPFRREEGLIHEFSVDREGAR